MGGNERANQRLDAFFKRPDGTWAITRSGGLHAELNNEPSIGAPWVYLYTGKPHKSQEIVRQVLNTLWKDARTASRATTTSARCRRGTSGRRWDCTRVFPAAPSCSSARRCSRGIVIRRANGKTITITADGRPPASRIIHELMVNGRDTTRAWLPDSFARNGGTLTFTLGSDSPRRLGQRGCGRATIIWN